jgi:hypothetical protein
MPPKLSDLQKIGTSAVPTAGMGLALDAAGKLPFSIVGTFPYDRVATTLDINTTAAETTLYSKTIVANDLGVDRMLRLTMLTDVLYNNVAGNTCRVRIKFGATTVLDWTHSGANSVLSANRIQWRDEILLSNLGTSSSQLLEFTRIGKGTGNMGDFTLTTGNFSSWVRGDSAYVASNTAAEGTTANKDLVVTVQWGTSSANNSYRRRYAVLYRRRYAVLELV